MFGNVLRSLVLDRDKMRHWEGSRDNAMVEKVLQKSDVIDIVGSQNVSNISAVTYPGNSSITYSVQTPSDSNGSVNKKGGYKTSIFVNGPRQAHLNLDSSSGSSNSLNLSDYEQRKPDDSTLYRSPSSLDSSQINYSQNDCSDIPGITITVADINHSTHNHKTPRNSPSDRNHIDHSTSNNHNDGHSFSGGKKLDQKGGRSSAGVKPDLNVVGQCDDNVPELVGSVPMCYSQTKYNVVSPPRPHIEPVFVGCRDVRDPGSVFEEEITSFKGSVRGFKNRVRAGIVTFWEETPEKRNYRHLEQGKIIVYSTSMSIVRETSDRCRTVRRLLQNYMVRYEERDLYMNREIQTEMRHRLSQEKILQVRLPHVFADGVYIGGAEELEKLNEAGKLRAILDNYQKVTVKMMCQNCGGFRFLPCDSCHGSKKSMLRNNFTEAFCALRCVQCDGNGMRRCDLCVDQQE